MIRPNGREPCRDLSRARSEPLAATASPTRRWLLIEQPGAWGRDAARESRLDAELGDHLARAMAALRGRLLLVRRPPGPERDQGPPYRWFAFDADRPGLGVRTGDCAGVDLRALPPAIAGDGPAPGEANGAGLVLVCTHGKHDPCCAESGREAVRALVDGGTDDLWECSHIGGDRFAGNILLLPEGLYFGRVDAEAAPVWEDARRERRILPEHYRGRATVSLFAQAAEHHVRERFGLWGFDDVVPVAVEGDAEQRRVVTVDAGGERVVVEVERTGLEPAYLTCSADDERRPAAYRAHVRDGTT